MFLCLIGGRSSSAIVHIHVIDENDNDPVFYPREYGVSLKVGAEQGTSVVVVHATDSDSNTFGRVKYNILSEQHLFTINSDSGQCKADLLSVFVLFCLSVLLFYLKTVIKMFHKNYTVNLI